MEALNVRNPESLALGARLGEDSRRRHDGAAAEAVQLEDVGPEGEGHRGTEHHLVGLGVPTEDHGVDARLRAVRSAQEDGPSARGAGRAQREDVRQLVHADHLQAGDRGVGVAGQVGERRPARSRDDLSLLGRGGPVADAPDHPDLPGRGGLVEPLEGLEVVHVLRDRLEDAIGDAQIAVDHPLPGASGIRRGVAQVATEPGRRILGHGARPDAEVRKEDRAARVHGLREGHGAVRRAVVADAHQLPAVRVRERSQGRAQRHRPDLGSATGRVDDHGPVRKDLHGRRKPPRRLPRVVEVSPQRGRRERVDRRRNRARIARCELGDLSHPDDAVLDAVDRRRGEDPLVRREGPDERRTRGDRARLEARLLRRNHAAAGADGGARSRELCPGRQAPTEVEGGDPCLSRRGPRQDQRRPHEASCEHDERLLAFP